MCKVIQVFKKKNIMKVKFCDPAWPHINEASEASHAAMLFSMSFLAQQQTGPDTIHASFTYWTTTIKSLTGPQHWCVHTLQTWTMSVTLTEPQHLSPNWATELMCKHTICLLAPLMHVCIPTHWTFNELTLEFYFKYQLDIWSFIPLMKWHLNFI